MRPPFPFSFRLAKRPLSTWLLVVGGLGLLLTNSFFIPPAATGPGYDLVFVSRPIADYGSFYVGSYRNFPREDGTGATVSAMPKDMPGVGPHSRFRVCPGGKLMIRRADGTLQTLIDGGQPGVVPDGSGRTLPYRLVDVNAPDVSYDGRQLVFAGALEGTYEPLSYTPASPNRLGHAKEPGAWRLYVINVDGTGLRQLTTSDLSLDLTQFKGPYGENVEFASYDDTDPAWLPDGRVVFSSTRFPVKAEYTGVRATHLYVVNADGTGLHRITTERNSADRPAVDPLTGRIVFSRWWRNFHYPYHSLAEEPYTEGYGQPAVIAGAGYDSRLGLTGHRLKTAGEQEGILPRDNMFRNSWQLQSVNPDGTDLRLFAGYYREEQFNHVYGGTFTDDGSFVANFFPMYNMTEAAGFGGIRRYARGAGKPTPLLGVSELQPANLVLPNAYGIYKSAYASEPAALPDGTLLVSYVPNTYERIFQDYGLYWFDPASRSLTLLYDNPGTAELRAKAIRPRPLPPVIADVATDVPGPLPPRGSSDIAQDGTFVFEDLNVFFNAPVDVPIVSAPKVGEAASIRFYAQPQRVNPGSFSNIDWPIFLRELPLDDHGGVRDEASPANVQLFEQLRTATDKGYKVPFTGGPNPDGAAHVAGLNFGRPGQTLRCVGCHAGHSLIPVPVSREEQLFTNLAPGADLTVSSSLVDGNRNHARFVGSLTDRRVKTVPNENAYQIWASAPGRTAGEWVQLRFRVPVNVRRVRLYAPRPTGSVNFQVRKATVQLFADETASTPLASTDLNTPLTADGQTVTFLNPEGQPADVRARVVRIVIREGSGTLFQHQNLVALGEVEVIASLADPAAGARKAAEPLALRDEPDNGFLRVYPNPAADEVEVAWLPAVFPAPALTVTNLKGQAVFRREAAPQPHSVRVDTRQWPSGTYVVTLRDGVRTLARRLVVHH